MDYQSKIKDLLIFLIILGLILPNLSFIQSEQIILPKNTEIAETEPESIGEELSFWQKMWNGIKDYWKATLWPRIRNFWERRIKSPVEEEAEKRKEIVEERIETEKEGIEEKIPETAKSFWQKFIDFWK